MSDRLSAEKLFNEMLQDYRSEIFATIAENWNLHAVQTKFREPDSTPF